MNKTYLLLGSNMGKSWQQLQTSIKHLEKKIGKVIRKSAIYTTAAWGNTNQPDFLNQVIVIETILTAPETLQHILAIEKKMGRIRTVKNAPRIIDIDILFFNKQIIQLKDLIIPHPEIQNRQFVLVPLNELSPRFKHPVLNKNIHQLLAVCTDQLNVKKF
ncbi:MAG: 2-amino-4-hydroxy-6-hydroxymethyldihydropteridine diphosphokinase [Ferruginibacter sp.]|nr:2-amino-4-hydroxy-6-hydroxymethyldihydropteridine diphosphokinase [Ferruginibacter sp.]